MQWRRKYFTTRRSASALYVLCTSPMSVCQPVCLSVANRCSGKAAEACVITQTIPHGSIRTLSIFCQSSWQGYFPAAILCCWCLQIQTGQKLLHILTNNSLHLETGTQTYNNNNKNNHDNVYGAVITTKTITTVHPVDLMNVD